MVQQMLSIIPESTIIAAHEKIGADGNFLILLECGNQFKKAGMTPIYLFDEVSTNIYVVAQETYGQKLQ